MLSVARRNQTDDEVSLDFTIAKDGQEVPADNALATLKNLTTNQMAGIITYPVGNSEKLHFCLDDTLHHTSLATLKNLTTDQMAGIITYPVGNFEKPHLCLDDMLSDTSGK